MPEDQSIKLLEKKAAIMKKIRDSEEKSDWIAYDRHRAEFKELQRQHSDILRDTGRVQKIK